MPSSRIAYRFGIKLGGAAEYDVYELCDVLEVDAGTEDVKHDDYLDSWTYKIYFS